MKFHIARLPALTAILLSLTSVIADTSSSSSSSSSSSVREFKLQGDALLAKGEYLGASRAYSSAIDLDPTSFNLHYLRATTYLSQGRHQPALADFSRLLQLKPDFHQAHLQRARILAKEGEFVEAQRELGKWLKSDKGKEDVEARELATRLTEALRAESIALKAHSMGDWPTVVDACSTALLVGPNTVPLRQLRLEAYEHLVDGEGYVGDLSRLTTLQPSSTTYSLRLAYYSHLVQNDPGRAAGYIKQALHYDPDSAPHRKVHKLVRSVEKQVAQARNFVEGSRYREALKILIGDATGASSTSTSTKGLVQLVKDAITTATPMFIPSSFTPHSNSLLLLELYRLTLKSYLGLDRSNPDELEKYADLVLGMPAGEGDLDALVAKGEVFNKKEMWEEAVRAFNEAFEKGGRSSRDIMGRLQTAQKRLKQSKAKDYYKVLGVSRDADLKTIKKAFRKKAKENHPDIGGSEEKMAQINEAYETLSSPELRERFDNGDDPNDPMAGAGGGGGGHPFHGNPFGGGGGRQFHFQQGFPGGGGRTQFHWG